MERISRDLATQRQITRRHFLAATLGAGAVALLSGCAGAPPAPTPAPKTGQQPAQQPGQSSPGKVTVPAGTRLAIGTGGTAGDWFPLGGGMAQMLNKHLGIQATAEVTAASVDNIKLIADRKTNGIGYANGDTAYEALQGMNQFKDLGKIPVRALFLLYPSYLQIVTSQESGIKTVPDLKGRRFAIGAPSSGVETKTRQILEAYGMDPDKDIQKERLSLAESVGAIKDRKIEAFSWAGLIPTASIKDLENLAGFTIKLIPHDDAITKMREKYGPYFVQTVIPAGTYKGENQDVKVGAVTNVVLVHEQFPEDVAYALLRTVFDNKAEWDAIHPAAKETKIESSAKDAPIPYHPAAIRFYKERGLWKGQ